MNQRTLLGTAVLCLLAFLGGASPSVAAPSGDTIDIISIRAYEGAPENRITLSMVDAEVQLGTSFTSCKTFFEYYGLPVTLSFESEGVARGPQTLEDNWPEVTTVEANATGLRCRISATFRKGSYARFYFCLTDVACDYKIPATLAVGPDQRPVQLEELDRLFLQEVCDGCGEVKYDSLINGPVKLTFGRVGTDLYPIDRVVGCESDTNFLPAENGAFWVWPRREGLFKLCAHPQAENFDWYNFLNNDDPMQNPYDVGPWVWGQASMAVDLTLGVDRKLTSMASPVTVVAKATVNGTALDGIAVKLYDPVASVARTDVDGLVKASYSRAFIKGDFNICASFAENSYITFNGDEQSEALCVRFPVADSSAKLKAQSRETRGQVEVRVIWDKKYVPQANACGVSIQAKRGGKWVTLKTGLKPESLRGSWFGAKATVSAELGTNLRAVSSACSNTLWSWVVSGSKSERVWACTGSGGWYWTSECKWVTKTIPVGRYVAKKTRIASVPIAYSKVAP